MGTMIQALKLDEEGYRGARFDAWNREVRGNNDLLNLSRPDAVRDIHLAYFRAGADIVSTNTFSSTAIAQADYGMEGIAYELNVAGATLAREAAAQAEMDDGKRRFVAGALGPTNRTASISPDVSNPGFRAINFDQLRAAYGEQVRGLIDGGADLLLIETIFDTLNAKAAIYAISEICEQRGLDVPIMISGTITDRSGRLLSGQTPGGVLEFGAPRRSGDHRAQLRARRARKCARISPRSAVSPTASSARTRTPACPTSSAITTRARNTWRSFWASSPRPVSSTWWAAAVAPRPSTSRPSPRRSPARRRAPFRNCRGSCGCRDWSRSRSRRKSPSSMWASAPTSPARPSSAS